MFPISRATWQRGCTDPARRKSMQTNEFDDKMPEKPHEESPTGHSGILVALTIGLVLALAGNLFLWMRSNQAIQDLAQMRDGTQTQISKLGEATTSLLEQRMQAINEEMKGVQDNAAIAVRRARSEAQKQGKELRSTFESTLEEQHKQVADELTQLKDATTATDSKISEVSTDVNGVKTDVGGVKTEVSSVKADLATTQSGLEKTGS